MEWALLSAKHTFVSFTLEARAALMQKLQICFRDVISWCSKKSLISSLNGFVTLNSSLYNQSKIQQSYSLHASVKVTLHCKHLLKWLNWIVYVCLSAALYLMSWSLGAAVSGLCLLVLALSLFYTGSLCKLKTPLPASLVRPVCIQMQNSLHFIRKYSYIFIYSISFAYLVEL